jgi:hypothetical protein
MFDRAWIETELEAARATYYRIEGAISVLEQMLQQLDEADEQPASLEITEEELQAMLPEGTQIVGGFKPHEDHV